MKKMIELLAEYVDIITSCTLIVLFAIVMRYILLEYSYEISCILSNTSSFVYDHYLELTIIWEMFWIPFLTLSIYWLVKNKKHNKNK